VNKLIVINGVDLALLRLGDSEDIPSSWAQDSMSGAGALGILPNAFRSEFGMNTTRADLLDVIE